MGTLSNNAVTVGTVKSNTASPPTVVNSSNVQVGAFCLAWLNLNGTGTPVIRASFNVSSIFDNGTGDYTINFATAFTNAIANADYCAVFGGATNDTARGGLLIGQNNVNVLKTTAAYRILGSSLSTENTGASPADPTVCHVAIFR